MDDSIDELRRDIGELDQRFYRLQGWTDELYDKLESLRGALYPLKDLVVSLDKQINPLKYLGNDE